MAMKGFFFSLDMLFAVIIAMMILIATSFYLSRGQEDQLSQLYLSKLTNDALVVLDKNGILPSLDKTNITNTLDSILPNNLAYKIDIKVYKCNDCELGNYEFDEVENKKISYISPNALEENSVIAKRTFLTFEGNRIKYLSNTELRLWLK